MEKITGDEDRQGDHTMIGSPLSEGKMVIKLRIPKLTAAMEDERSSETTKRVCLECKKEFSSGKALGGHMRIHVQAANRNTFLKPSKTTKFKKSGQDFNNGDHGSKPNYKNSVNGEGKPICSICGKIFPSMKSLFGHMRCHPERLWRGIVPPPDTPTTALYRQRSNIVDDDGDEVVDLTKFLRGWTVTERRGRRALKAADEDEVLREAVEDLMSLAHGDHPTMAESDVSQRQLRAEVFEGTNSNSPTNKDNKIDEKSPGDSNNGKAFMEEEIEGKPVAKVEVDGGGGMNMIIKNFSDNESDSRNTNEQMMISCKYKKNLSNNPNKIKKRKKMKLMMELEQGFTQETVGGHPPLPLTSSMASRHEQPESKYKCTTCNKSFTSHQALGGHRSSHNKSKITPTDHHQIDQEDDYDSSVMNQTSDNVEKEVEFAGDAMVAASGLHQCKICDKIFPTGQALGGHKRCHWTGAIEAQAPSSQVTSTGEAASQSGGGRRRILDFDLNEVPPAAMMEDEGGGGGGTGYASSSYNSNMG
ncbi:uncharacterized protein LOC112500381 [Cynara cardunculus var. scolymus]|uniref:uncharacterized protein LOC112500381 n=1 Tax=Cynara cardunculus var. scolymus TaxID=59895 RepID=UPI000D624DF6|nr:uncharacterized protein LOC112500381 [Cynara cardunculus var. scolymus]